MVDILSAILVGYAFGAVLCGLLDDDNAQSKALIRVALLLIIISVLTIVRSGGQAGFISGVQGLIEGAIYDHLFWFILGCAGSAFVTLLNEGYFYALWIRLHPESAPTQDVGAGQRARVAGFAQKAVPATLVGTSTGYLAQDLDLRTETLVRLCYCTFDDVSAFSLAKIESHLRLGTGRKQKAFHKLVAGLRGRPDPKRTVHRYWRSVNGSSRMGSNLFGDLCDLAYNTGNLGGGTIARLRKVGKALKLTPEEMTRSLSRVR